MMQYTYGCPRVGNEALAEYIEGQGTLYRVTHTNDIVPTVPWLYTQSFPEYWITSGNDATVTAADIEVIQKSESKDGDEEAEGEGLGITAHLHYFGDIAGCR